MEGERPYDHPNALFGRFAFRQDGQMWIRFPTLS
jgi:hypothetical protein